MELYSRFIMSSNCQVETKAGEKCDRKTAFPTGRCAGVISMPGTLTNLLMEGGEYAPPPELRMDSGLPEGAYWGRRKVFPGSRRVVDWTDPDLPLVDCDADHCPLAKHGINYAPFFAEGGESYALNGRQSKPAATDTMWDMFVWLSTLNVGDVPLAGTYRKSQLTSQSINDLAEHWNNTVMAQDMHDVLMEYFKNEQEGGNPVQDLFIIGAPDYMDVLDVALHENFILASIEDGGLFNMDDPSKSIDPVKDKEEFDSRYDRFISELAKGIDDVNAQQNGGALQQLLLWRGALDISPMKSKDEICHDLLASDTDAFDKLECINVVNLKDLCQSEKDVVEAYAPGTCKETSRATMIVIIVLCSIVGAGIVLGVAYFAYKRYVTYQRIRKSHEQLMEATLQESVRALHQLDYPLHLVRGDEFVDEGKLMRHEVLRNTHKLTVLDSLSDVDAFIAAGKHVVFFSHQWTSFKNPDPSGDQYACMCSSIRELAAQNGWNDTLKDVFVWVDYSCIPQANSSTQNLAIRSLAAYASSATFFIIIAPETTHAELDDTCDLDTYQKRMWCRAEQVCHSMRNGTAGMYLAVGGDAPLAPVKNDFFIESLHVFDGELTCCRLEHKGMGSCDRQSLVIPLLGLYGELFRASHEAKAKGGNAESLASVETFLIEIEKHQEEVFPRTFNRVMWRKNKRVIEEVLLFGDLIDRMKAKISSGVGFSIDDDNQGTLSTKGSDFLRHGASDFLRHGVVHGSSSNGMVHGVRIETAVGSLP